MASNAPKECEVCNEEFNDRKHCPRNLPCSHCFCSYCIEQLIVANRKSCPLCRKNFQATSVKDLGINRNVLELLQYVAELERTTKLPERRGEATSLEKIREENAENSKENFADGKTATIQIESAIRTNLELRDYIVKVNRIVKNKVQTKLKEIETKHLDYMEYLEKENERLETHLDAISGRRKQLKDANTNLQAARNLQDAAPVFDKTKEFNKIFKKSLKDLENFLSSDKSTQQRIRKSAEEINGKIKIVQDILSTAGDEEDGIDLTPGMVAMAVQEEAPEYLAGSSQRSYHSKAASTAHHHPEVDQHINSAKRERTGERATSQTVRGASRNSVDERQLHPYFEKSQRGSRAPLGLLQDRYLLHYIRNVNQPPDEICSICMWSLQQSSGFRDDEDEAAGSGYGFQSDGVVSLNLCDHMFHLACVRKMTKVTPQFLECPNCHTIHGRKKGNQPEGQMHVTYMPQSLPGYKGVATIKISYIIKNGVQGPEHPHPGSPYCAIGFPRVAYLPRNEKGFKVLNLIDEAFKRKLIFTIGTSATSGMQDAVIWNGIHHKTEWYNAGGHGYPDPNYLDNVLMELALQGVSESSV